ncbi:MAG TPA: dihydropteroate synthase [Verrucomicrobiae bacterium]|jgi:5-methyltetrahydrofolate--homocysteine methyltransferase|nr:dihydropteroate synthase [Verrucomicrobiae bacterium]
MTTSHSLPRPFTLIGELINNSFARAARAFQEKDLAKYQELARLQAGLGANFLTVNIDGTQKLNVRAQDMLDFLPRLVPALQEATDLPLAFDNPSLLFHEKAFSLYRRKNDNQPILNSVAASRPELDRMIEMVAQYDTRVVVMASEKFVQGGGAQCLSGLEVYQAAKEHVKLLRDRAGRRNDEIIIDPGLAPVSADTYGLVNMGLDAMKMIREDGDLAGVHISVGLTNFSFGVPKEIRTGLENAYITLAHANGLDWILGNPEKELKLLPESDRYLQVVREALEQGRPLPGETQEDAGFRQSIKIMDLFDLQELND